MSSTQVSTLGPRRLDVRTRATRTEFAFPAARPQGAAPLARPQRPVTPGRVGVASSCAGVSSARAVAPVSRLLRLKVAAVAAVALLGVGVSTAGFVSWSQPDPAVDVVVGDPGWSHVTGN